MSGIAGALGGTWLASSGMAGLAATAGMGYLGYKYAGTGGAIGAVAGTAIAGPIGGAVLGLMLGHLKDEEHDIPSFNLLWEVVDGQVKNVADTWRNMAKNDEVFNAAQEFVQTTTDFFHKLSTVTGNSKLNMPDWQFQLQGVGDNIKQVLNQQTTQDVIKALFGSFGDLTETFGPGFKDQIQKLFIDTMSQNLGMFVFGQDKQVFQNYMNWKFNQFTSMPSEQAMSAFQDWMGAQDIFSPVGRPGIQANSIFDLFHGLPSQC